MKEKKQKKPRIRPDYFRMFASAYYVLQFLLVHMLLFGFEFEPVNIVARASSAFRLDEIVRAAVRFYEPFLAGFTFESSLLLMLMLVPYLLMLAWSLRFVALYLFVTYQLIAFIVIKLRQLTHRRRITLDNIVVCKIGAPGQGKSSSGLYEAVTMARQMWRKLIIKHYIMKNRVKKWRKDPLKNEMRLRDWEEVEFSYNFFKNKNCVPCLVTNIPVCVGKMTSKVIKDHIEQKKRLPAHVVIFLDEVGAMMSVDTAKQRMGDTEEARDAQAVSDFFRLIRHFIDGRVVCTEQDSENIYIDVRRVVSFNEYMISQRWVLRPYLFMAIAFPIKWYIVKFEALSKIFARPYQFIQKLISCIGFRKYRYLRENNTERASGMQTGKRTFYLPSKLPFEYDDRTFRNLYNCKDEVCEPEVFTKMQLDNDPDTIATFKRQRPPRLPHKQKRKVLKQ